MAECNMNEALQVVHVGEAGAASQRDVQTALCVLTSLTVSSVSPMLQASGRNASQDRSVTTVPVVCMQLTGVIKSASSSPPRLGNRRQKHAPFDRSNQQAKATRFNVLQDSSQQHHEREQKAAK
ncbi:MAG: hypothetical protein AAFO98_02055 [Pseudomonadota bacterium]